MLPSDRTAHQDPLPSVQRPESVYERMKQDIIVGAFPAGTPLVETRLAEQYTVSRTPIREALHRLEHDGLVERGDRSMRVRYYTATQIYELYYVRSVLEGAAARAAAESHTAFDSDQLLNLLDRSDAPDLEIAERVRLNRTFHATIWQASHNSMLIGILDQLYVTSVAHMMTTLGGRERWIQSLDEHRQMVDAMLDHDTAVAERLVVEHLHTARDIRLRSMAST